MTEPEHLIDQDEAENGSTPDIASVTFQVEHVEKVNAGRLVALATVLINVDGVELRIQGVRIMSTPTGVLMVEAPRFRRPGGEWVPAVTLPEELKRAIAAEILAAVERIR